VQFSVDLPTLLSEDLQITPKNVYRGDFWDNGLSTRIVPKPVSKYKLNRPDATNPSATRFLVYIVFIVSLATGKLNLFGTNNQTSFINFQGLHSANISIDWMELITPD